MSGERVCSAAELEWFVREVCRGVGAEEDIAGEVAGHLVRANLAGHDSHGVLRLPWYVAQCDRGQIVPAARPRVIRETAVTALVDAGHGFGQYSTVIALEEALRRAREHGVAAVAVRRSNHIGRLGEYAERAARAGLVGITTVGATGRRAGIVAPFGGRARFLGTNPWAIGVPAGAGQPLIYDGATSAIAEGKIRVAQSKGAALPPGCIIDREGRPAALPDDFYGGGALLPLGGATGGHKGYGLALASALIGGLAMIDGGETVPASGAADPTAGDDRGRMGGVFVIAIDPAAFGERASYEGLVGEALAAAKRVPPAVGVAEVLVPGEPEAGSRGRREREGIPIPETIWGQLAEVGGRYGVALPE